jgi:hypothetical protein
MLQKEWTMRLVAWVCALVTAVMAAGSAIATAQKKGGGGGGCSDVPIRWYVYPVATLDDGSTIPAAIRGDGNWYSNTGGASNAVIHRCGTDPTYDATMAVSKPRYVDFVFPAAVSGSVLEEVLAPGTYQNRPFLNVRNILCAGCANPHSPFTTHMAFQLYSVDRQDYRFRFMPPAVDALDRHIDPAVIPAENDPYEASPVRVIPQPYDCGIGGVTKPSWIVRAVNPSADGNIPAGENLQVGTLRRITRNGTVHAGQYAMAFEVRVEALSCFSY